MIITIDTSQPLSTNDKQALQSLISEGVWPPVTTTATEEDKPTPRKRAAAKAKTPEPTDVKDAAVQLATRLASEQRKDVIRAALETVGATRVSTLDEEQAAAFIAAVEAEDD